MENYLLSAIVLIPIIAAILIMLMPEKEVLGPRVMATSAALLTVALSVVAYVLYDPSNARNYEVNIPWIEGLGMQYHVAADGVSVAMLLLTSITIFTGCLISWEIKERHKEFFALLLILVAGVFGVFIAFDLFLFLVFYELAVLPMYLLIGIWGTGRREYSAMKLTLYLMLGSALLILPIFGLYVQAHAATGVWSMDYDFLSSNFRLDEHWQSIFFPMVFIGFGTIGGLWPVHTWSPDGHASAPSAVSMLHAGVLMKLGGYGIIRIGLQFMPDGAQDWAFFFACLTVVNIVYGSLSAMRQTDMKYIIAYSSVSHLGLVTLGICTLSVAGINGAVYQMFAHGIMTALLFALVGVVYGRLHTRDIREMGGLAKIIPFTATAFVFAGMTGLGLPGLSGFVSEVLVLTGAFSAGVIGMPSPLLKYVALICLTGVVFTAIYVLRAMQKMFFGEPTEALITSKYYITLRDTDIREKLALGVLMAVIVLAGAYPAWLVNLINSGLAHGVFPVLGLSGF
ncbi:MAG: NADH-quinone oxidoreductase subunit M [Bacteroidetes bacterium]|nr:NADH-quinone oxidoreductase subunit M [Bacteroidota bacterium]